MSIPFELDWPACLAPVNANKIQIFSGVKRSCVRSIESAGTVKEWFCFNPSITSMATTAAVKSASLIPQFDELVASTDILCQGTEDCKFILLLKR